MNVRMLALVTVLCLVPGAANAAIWHFSVGLSPSQAAFSVPPTVPEVDLPGLFGAGFGVVNFDDITLELDWEILFASLTGDPFIAHFHAGGPGVGGGVFLGLGPAGPFPGPPLGPGSGAYAGGAVLDAVGDAAFIAVLGAASLLPPGAPIETYVNIHTPAYPGGEIRGQLLFSSVTPIPLPAAAWLLASGLGLVGAPMLRKRQAG